MSPSLKSLLMGLIWEKVVLYIPILQAGWVGTYDPPSVARLQLSFLVMLMEVDGLELQQHLEDYMFPTPYLEIYRLKLAL